MFAASLGMVTVALTATPAAAHTALEASSPGDGVKLGAAPSQIQLVFTDPVRSTATRLNVRGPGGGEFATGRPRVIAEKVTQPLRPLRAAGKYRVEFRVVAADGHLQTGTLQFTLTVATTGKNGNLRPGALKPAPLAKPPRLASDERADPLMPWGLGLGVLGACAVVGGAFWLGRRVTHDLD